MKVASMNRTLGKPRRRSGLLRSVREIVSFRYIASAGVLLIVSLFLLFTGCGSTSPRFRVRDSRVAAAERVTESKPDSARTIQEDVETSARDAESVIARARSFKSEKNEAISDLDRAKIMREISKMMGVSYRLGGTDEEGIDCSAYTMNVYRNSLGRQLPRSSAEQYSTGQPVEYQDLKFGDLVFFNTTGESASHVGMYLGDDLFAHASVSLGVTISSLESFYYKKRYEGARRVIQ
jgi:cell wall-associated NlpC family hydrolase